MSSFTLEILAFLQWSPARSSYITEAADAVLNDLLDSVLLKTLLFRSGIDHNGDDEPVRSSDSGHLRGWSQASSGTRTASTENHRHQFVVDTTTSSGTLGHEASWLFSQVGRSSAFQPDGYEFTWTDFQQPPTDHVHTATLDVARGDFERYAVQRAVACAVAKASRQSLQPLQLHLATVLLGLLIPRLFHFARYGRRLLFLTPQAPLIDILSSEFLCISPPLLYIAARILLHSFVHSLTSLRRSLRCPMTSSLP